MKLNITKPTMKNSVLILVITALLVACGAPNPKAQLEKLKKQKSDLETKIAALEEEVAKTDTSAKEEKSLEVAVMPLTATIFKSYIEVQGRVDADESVSLSSEIPGTITKINVKVGDHVNKGQVLAETDTRAIQMQLAAMQTSLTLVTQLYDRQKNLWDQKIGTEMQYLQAKASKEALESSISATQEQLRMSKITSPIDGTVDGVNIKLGQAVQPGLPAIVVVNFSTLKVKADIAESYASRIKNGNDVTILFPDMNDSAFSTIQYASRTINAMTRTFAVEAMLDSKKEFRPNLVAKIKINDYQSPKPCLVMPVKYIQKTTNEIYVLVAEKGKAVKKTITVGREYNGLAEVTSGVNEGDLLITLGYDLVIEGDNISFKK